jgi:2-polyprenyl-3-methyl-5-hydroxy-6-metoxy-1,4-benzoquinol methylase
VSDAVATKTSACPRCSSASAHRFDASDRNRAVTDRRFSYRRCTACDVTWLVDVPRDLESYYPGDYHGFLGADELAVAARAEAPRVAMISRHVDGGQMVEIGPSQGVFSAAARMAGFDVVALEMDEACCRHLSDVVGVRAIRTAAPAEALPDLEPSRAVVMWHVIEHLPDPWTTLRAIAANLEPGGVLAVATPNPESLQARAFGARWVHLDAPRHLTLIPLPALSEELSGLGLELVDSTASDPIGRDLNRLGWERSILRPPALRPNPRFAHSAGRALTAIARPWEERDLHGAAYTAIFRKGTAPAA